MKLDEKKSVTCQEAGAAVDGDRSKETRSLPHTYEIDDELQWRRLLEACGPLVLLWASVDLTFSARRAARSLFLKDTRALLGWLVERRLPPYQILRNWYFVVRLAEIAENGSLSKWALQNGRDPAIYYRFIERTTGASWKVIREGGLKATRLRAIRVLSPWRIASRDYGHSRSDSPES